MQSAGWVIANQLVFTTPASARHTAKLRKVLNDIGILTYYTFSVKGYKENSANFTPNARTVQEEIEEKYLGRVPEEEIEEVQNLILDAENATENVQAIRERNDMPFLSTDRNIMNLPGVGKSLTFRTIGITRYADEFEFDHDRTRSHSPIINRWKSVMWIKSISEYLRQLEEMGDRPQ